MISNQKVEYIAGSQARLTATIAKSDVRAKYQESLKKHLDRAAFPGFRKGHVPLSVLEKKYGDAIKMDVAGDLVEDAVKEIFPTLERKALGYAYPELESAPALNPEEDFTFTLKFDVEPEFAPVSYRSMSMPAYKINVTEADLTIELTHLQERNAVVEEKTSSVDDGDIVNVDYVEMEGDRADEKSRRSGFVFTTGRDETLYAMDSDVIGMKKGDEKEISKSYASDYKFKELAGRTVSLKVKVNSVKRRILPKLDDEFAKDIDEKFETLADIKADIRAKLEKNAVLSARNRRLNDIITKLTDETAIDVPESMIVADAENKLRDFARQTGMTEDALIKMMGGSKQAFVEARREESVRSVKSRLILDSIAKTEGIKIEKDELESLSEEICQENGSTSEQMKARFGVENFMRYIENEASERRLMETLSQAVKISETKESGFADFMAEENT